MTELKMLSRHLRVVQYARELGITPIMLFCQAGDAARLEKLRADPAHPLNALGGLWKLTDRTVDGVLAGVQDLVTRYEVRGVISCGDRYVEPAGALAHLLRLPGTGWPAARISRNKLFQRYALPAYSPRWRAVEPCAREKISMTGYEWAGFDLAGPLVVKPTSRWGSSGVQKLSSPAALTAAVRGYPDDEIVLAEERVTGPEFSVESLIQDGTIIWSGITRKQTTEGYASTFVEMAHTVPAGGLTEEQQSALLAASADILRILGVRNGIAHAEYRLAEQGVVLMETALRVPGDGITQMWDLATGGSIDERIVDIAIGRETTYPRPRRRVRHVFVQHPEGTLIDVLCPGTPVSWTARDFRWPAIEPVSCHAPSRSCAVLVSKLPGDRLGPIVDSDARSASVIVDAALDEDIEQIAERACGEIRIVVS
jgi:hypothetical protein